MAKNGLIYRITNRLNGKIYIGQTTDLKNRIRHYRGDNKRYESFSPGRQNRPIDKAMYEYGFENFDFDVLEDNIPIDKLDDAEIEWISYFGSTDPEVGYNEDEGGNFINHRLNMMYKSTNGSPSNGWKHSRDERLRRSKGIIIYFPDTDEIEFRKSAKVLADELGNSRSEVTKAIKRGSKLRDMYIFYQDDDRRLETMKAIKDKKLAMNSKKAEDYLFEYAKAFHAIDELVFRLNDLGAIQYSADDLDMFYS